jgi:hypothetical protein
VGIETSSLSTKVRRGPLTAPRGPGSERGQVHCPESDQLNPGSSETGERGVGLKETGTRPPARLGTPGGHNTKTGGGQHDAYRRPQRPSPTRNRCRPWRAWATSRSGICGPPAGRPARRPEQEPKATQHRVRHGLETLQHDVAELPTRSREFARDRLDQANHGDDDLAARGGQLVGRLSPRKGIPELVEQSQTTIAAPGRRGPQPVRAGPRRTTPPRRPGRGDDAPAAGRPRPGPVCALGSVLRGSGHRNGSLAPSPTWLRYRTTIRYALRRPVSV